MRWVLLAAAALAVLGFLAARQRGPVVAAGSPAAPAPVAAAPAELAASPLGSAGTSLTGAGNPLSAPSLLTPVVTVAPVRSPAASARARGVARSKKD